MSIVSRAAVNLRYCEASTAEAVVSLLQQYGLPTKSPYGVDVLSEATLLDKKMTGDSLHLVVPEAVGRCSLITVPAREIPAWLRAGGVQ